MMARVLGCNPGGQVQGFEIDPAIGVRITKADTGRLMQREEAEAYGKGWLW